MTEILKTTKQPGDFICDHFEGEDVITYEELEDDLQVVIN
jgi:hypothetical protein